MSKRKLIIGATWIASFVLLGLLAIGGLIALWVECVGLFGETPPCPHQGWREAASWSVIAGWVVVPMLITRWAAIRVAR